VRREGFNPHQPAINEQENIMKSKIAIIGKGNVGSALRQGLERADYQVRTATKEAVAETAAWADVIIVAVPFSAVQDVAQKISEVTVGKTVVDATNAVSADFQLAIGYTTSGAEELQKALPRAHVVKAFNTVFAQHMSEGKVNGKQLTVFAAGDDEAARKTALELAGAIGFDAVDGGPLKNARYLEPMAYFNIQLGYVLGLGPNIGFQLVH
jgi:predicted dinucleotide-binding enzyme